MKKIQSSALMIAIAFVGTTAFTACSSSDVGENNQVVIDDNGNVGVKSEFVLSIPRTVVGTRMSDAVTQSSGKVADFRGIDNIRLIPFDKEPTKSTEKISDILNLSAVNALNSPGAVNYKVYANQFVPVGTKNFLFYGKAIDKEEEVAISTMDEKFHYGILHAEGLTEEEFTKPNDIKFYLEQINTSEAEQANNAIGKNIVNLLNDLANTKVEGIDAEHNEWRTTTNLTLATLYKRFTCISTYSSDNLAVLLGKLYFSMDFVQNNDPARAIVNAIKKKIENACDPNSAPVNGEPVSLKSEYKGYPANIGLPDGAVRVRWSATEKKFKDVSARYTKNFDLKLTDYVYPAALWYYVNTPLKAAFDIKSDKYDKASKWEEVISSVYNNAADEVKAGTQSIALQYPAEYGVGRIETKVKMGEESVFRDARGKEVNVGDGYKLTGILIGGQTSVGYNFRPTDADYMTIYDREMSGDNIIAKPNYTTFANQTLALETEANQVVYAAIELVNGGAEFVGADGVIPAGGTFYMAVRLDPHDAGNYQAGTLDKIIQQDYVTKLTVTIKNGSTSVDRNDDDIPDVYLKDEDDNIIGVDKNGDGVADEDYDINGDGKNDKFISDPAHGGPGWDTDNDGEVDLPIVPDADGNYPDVPPIPEGLGNATNGVPDLTSPGIELGTSVNLEWKEGLTLNPEI